MSAYNHPKAVVQKWEVPNLASSMRADLYLIQKVKRLSRSSATQIISQGDFRKSTCALKPSTKLAGGEVVELWRMPPDEKPDIDTLNIEVVHEDDDILVVNKPPSLAVHPSARYLYCTLTHWLRECYPDGPPRICHRLDRETSGILVCAKSSRAEAEIKGGFKNGLIKKTYVAIVHGNLKEPMHLNWPLALQGERGLVGIRMIRDDVVGLPSITDVVPVQYDAISDYTLVRCHPKTGRQHQIRAHLAIAGFPIVGDKLYAMGDDYFDRFTKGLLDDDPPLAIGRHALHAAEIEFELQGEVRKYKLEFPDDMMRLMYLRL